jgi:hypothetical protein
VYSSRPLAELILMIRDRIVELVFAIPPRSGCQSGRDAKWFGKVDEGEESSTPLTLLVNRRKSWNRVELFNGAAVDRY